MLQFDLRLCLQPQESRSRRRPSVGGRASYRRGGNVRQLLWLVIVLIFTCISIKLE